jgi:WD40 repeat protein
MTFKFVKNGTELVIPRQTETGQTSIDIYSMSPEEFKRIRNYTVPKIITCFDITQDGSVLATGSESGKVQIWNISLDETEIHLEDTQHDHKMSVTCIKFHPTKPLFLTGSKDGTARLYQLCEKKLATCISIISPYHKTIPEITSLGFSYDGLMIIIGDSKNTVYRQEIETSGKHYRSMFLEHSGSITRVSVCHNGDLAVASGSQIYIYGNYDQKIREMHYVNAFACHDVLPIICASDSFGGRVNIYVCSPSSSYYDLKMFFDNYYAEDVLFHPTEPILAIYMKYLKKIHFYRISDDYATTEHIFTITL